MVVLSSAQTIDRLVTVYRAAKRCGRRFAVDLYSAEVAASAGRDTIPHLADDWPLVSTYVPQRQRVRVKEAEELDRVRRVTPHRVFDEDLAAAPGTWVLHGAFQSRLWCPMRLEPDGLECGMHGGPWVSRSMEVGLVWMKHRALAVGLLGCPVCHDAGIAPGQQGTPIAIADVLLGSRHGGYDFGEVT